MGKLVVLDHTGHTDLAWDQADLETVETAAERFAQALLNGSIAVRSKEPGRPAEILREFDPAAKEIVILPPMVGG